MRPDREQQSPIGTAATQAFQHSHGRKRAAATAVPGGTSGVTKCAEFRSGAPASAIKADAPIPVRQSGFGKSSRPLENLPRFAWKIEFHLSQPSSPEASPAAPWGRTRPPNQPPNGRSSAKE